MRRCWARATRRRRRFGTCGRSAPTPSACRRCRRPSWRGTWAWRSSGSRASPTWPRACSRRRSITRRSWKQPSACGGSSSRFWRGSLAASDEGRLSVAMVEVDEGREDDFVAIAREFSTIIATKGYGRPEVVRDESTVNMFYAVHHWTSVAAAEACHGDPDIHALTGRLYQIARVTHVVNGVRPGE